MGTNHSQANLSRQAPSKKLVILLTVTAGYMFLEAIGGYLSNSLALMADAGHMLADVTALIISLIAFVIAKKPADSKASFGYHRAEIIAALMNGVALLLIAFFIVKEAILRFFNEPNQIEAPTMILIALGGLVVNIFGLALLHQDKKSNLNIRGAWLHVFSDTLGSIGVVISGILIYLFDWRFLDSLTSVLIAILVSYAAIHLILETVRVLMEQSPKHLNAQEVSNAILTIKHVLAVHDLHIWTIASGMDALSVHVVVSEKADHDNIIQKTQSLLKQKFNIFHETIQVEKQCPKNPENNFATYSA